MSLVVSEGKNVIALELKTDKTRQYSRSVTYLTSGFGTRNVCKDTILYLTLLVLY